MASRGLTNARLRSIVVAAPLVLVLGLATVLAFQALDATRSHRQAVERTLGDYADFAAFIVANAARQELDRRLLYAFTPVRRQATNADGVLPPASAVGLDPAEASRCAADGVATPTYFRIVLSSGERSTSGGAIAGHTASTLADTLEMLARSEYRREWSWAHVFTDFADAPLLAYTVLHDSAGEPTAIYAKTSCLGIDGTSIFAIAMKGTAALPPSLTGGVPNDSLFSARVTGPDGRVIWESQRTFDSRATGQAPFQPQWGGAQLATVIRPDIADRLVIGGIPYSRAPMAFLMLVLILVLSGIAIVQLRRQHELVRLRERFVSGVSHELRTPLQQILVFSELLRMRRIETDAERQHAVEVIERETRRLIQLVENVLSFARAARNEDPLVFEDVDLGTIARDTIHAFQPLAAASRARIELDTPQPVVARADANASRRILLNLLDNAVKYGPREQTITVRVDVAEDRARIIVDDQGPGIPREHRDRVWQPFHRLERDHRSATTGSGMGLAIVADLVDRSNGTAAIEDAPGGGTRFVITLPRPLRP